MDEDDRLTRQIRDAYERPLPDEDATAARRSPHHRGGSSTTRREMTRPGRTSR